MDTVEHLKTVIVHKLLKDLVTEYIAMIFYIRKQRNSGRYNEF